MTNTSSVLTVAFFPGQGSQTVGMGKDLFQNFKSAQTVFEEASDSTHLDIRKLCFDGPEAELLLTENTQPCLLTVSVAAFRIAVQEFGFLPAAVAGHSLGEYSALVAAGSLPLAKAAAWVRERGRAMQQAVPAGQGTMAAVMGLADADVERLCAQASENARKRRASGENSELSVAATVEPANFNAPGQIVIAGSTDAVAEAIALIKGGGEFPGGKAIPLSVSAPFHSTLMSPARTRMAELFANADSLAQPRRPVCPYVPNRTARLTQESGIIFELLVEQVDHAVLWKQSVTHLLEQNYTRFVEFGPGKVLSGLTKRIAQPLGKSCDLLNVSDVASLTNTGKVLAGPAPEAATSPAVPPGGSQ
ncbi:MAG: [acyl-carrier-protein] S-malonyltransferase [Bdellovibrionales bacterium GWB1_52_6]|nr:MAG: [acyl-carrier-protein] S-malonyltransferase [Bdellovibrionales bacterium GWB1_52_6]OFZ06038.1 MAG: [acyl-carrier-protein] S-malonyltransferase [Bdellovibrionales bacterium GWA1_52_35]HCM39337.1 [acyl-carrier-protein] S-malonyltransferase [Bdellovibrionales bacterium]